MTEEKKLCRTCKAEVALAKLEPFSGEEAGVKLTISGLTAYLCQKGHKRFLYPELPVHLAQALLLNDNPFGVPSAKEKGFFKKHLICPGCKAALPAPSAAATLKKTIELKDVAPFEVTVEVPQAHCNECGKDAIGPADSIGPAIMHAAGLAYRGIDLPPG